MIEVVAAALARARRRRLERDLTCARQEVSQAIGQVLGPRGAMAAMVDSRTAADLISDPRQISLYSRLLAEDADIVEEMGQPAQASAIRLRALELMLETVIRKLELADDDRAHMLALSQRVGRSALGPRYVAAADEVSRGESQVAGRESQVAGVSD